jgi:hypothetical protein
MANLKLSNNNIIIVITISGMLIHFSPMKTWAKIAKLVIAEKLENHSVQASRLAIAFLFSSDNLVVGTFLIMKSWCRKT